MGGGACFDADEAGRKTGEEKRHFASLKLTADRNSSGCIDPVHLKNAFSKIETQRCNLHRGRLPFRGVYRRPQWHTDAVQRGPSTSSTPVG
jgi:hypothetical protein